MGESIDGANRGDLVLDELATEKPFQALYETIGRCGRPPGDAARQAHCLPTELFAD